ncbi:hypothetical protein [Zoogloea dura]|jgi:hypothetical protein|uniref:Carboxypeptidase regulatory-like domain-containing protein n=1 Tax=Zoogloea dura TaxID=2728840 RepID=A0A848G240_9RHOO|nr:hypothetical protein [Zoogloea dura]NML24513.1 hypothetical protein [Zoogloea dura]
MDNTSASDFQGARPPLGHTLRAGLFGLLLLTSGLPVLAGEWGMQQLYCSSGGLSGRSAGPSPRAVEWMSGGVGAPDRDRLRAMAGSYNVLMVFSDRQGHYLADVPFAVKACNGRPVHADVSEGPFLYLRLPPGCYRMSARLDDAWRSQPLQVGAGARLVRMSFISRQ